MSRIKLCFGMGRGYLFFEIQNRHMATTNKLSYLPTLVNSCRLCVMKRKVILILDNLRSVYNTASIFRTADGAGVLEIFLCGTTPEPIDRFGRKRKDFAKVSLGAEESVSWKYFETTTEAIQTLKSSNFDIIALEQDDASVLFDEYVSEKNIALVVGEETQGLQKNILKQCDAIVEIPMRGTKESLNVSVATGVVLYQILKK